MATPSAKGSLLVRGGDGLTEARVRESAILAGCLNHPDLARALEDRLERLAFRCPDLGAVRDALLSAVAAADGRESLLAAVAARIGHDPLPALAGCGPVRANRHLRAGADPALAARAIDEELTRHAALTGRADEIREAVADVAAADDTLTLRVRAAAEAEQSANIRPLEDDRSDDETERLEFARVVAAAAASPPRRPRKH